MRKNHVTQSAVLLAIAAVTAGMSLSIRTDAQQVVDTLRMHAGDTLELGTDTVSSDPQFSWVLTRDRKFQSAQRSRFFQTRFAQAGTYVLDVSIQNAGGGANDYRAFTLVVDDVVSAPPAIPTDATDAIPLQAAVRTEPPIIEGKVYLPAGGGILKIDPSVSQGKITAYEMDIDATVDTDKDGNPTNDKDTLDTLSEKNGSAVYVYLMPKAGVRTITLSVANLTAPAPSTLSFDVVFGGTPPVGASASASASSGPSTQPGQDGPISVQTDGLVAIFEAFLDPAQTTGKELLYAWDFGDRGKSLLNRPTHTYAAAGTYAVTLTVTDISTGQMFFTGNGSVSVSAPTSSSSSSSSSSQAVVSSSASSVSSASSSSSSQSGGGSSFSIGSFIKVALIMILLLALAIGLYALIHWVKGKATGRLQDTLEKMEKTIVKKDAATDVVEGTVEPMKLKKETAKTNEGAAVAEKELAKTEFASSTRTNETPSTTAGPVPSWLAKAGTTPAATPVPTAPAQPKAEQKTPDWLKPQTVPTQETKPAPQPAPGSVGGPVPDWLKPKTPAAQPAAAPTPVPAPVTPAPIATPVSVPTQTTTTTTTTTTAVTQTQSEKAPVPDWLKPKPQAPATPPPAPTPPAPVVTPVAKPAENPKPQQAPAQPKPEQPKQNAPKPKPAEPSSKPQNNQAPANPDQKKQAEPQKPKAETPKPQEQKQPQKPQQQAKPKLEAPKPEAPKPAPTPKPQAPAPAAPPAQPQAQPTPIAPAEPKNDDGQTIAIIQADSLSK